ncbi:MAG: acyl-CoA thioesterase domain-containing protein [Pseudomonadota bacterium]
MRSPAEALARTLRLDALDTDAFTGQPDDFGAPNTYGGQLIGQAISASAQCVDGRALHSMHAYFMRAGQRDKAIRYAVNRLRDGGNFSARRVQAYQDDALLFSGICSFHTFADHLEIQALTAPDCPPPAALPAIDFDAVAFPFRRRDGSAGHPLSAFEIRGEPSGVITGIRSAENTMWFRWLGEASQDAAAHAALFGWLSDFFLLPTALRLTGHWLADPNLKIASLDHALWLHRPFSMRDWMRFDYRARLLSHGRAHASADIFDTEGVLLASLAQEGVLQLRPSAAPTP